MQQYRQMLEHIIENGVDKGDRTGTGTRSVFGYQMRFDLSKGFPMVTGKFTPFKLVATELLWFLKGNPDISYLHEHDNHIWDEWVKPDGTFGPIYGQQWRSWPNVVWDGNAYEDEEHIDQIANVINKLKTNPDDRRMIVSAWNVADVESGEMALPPCHAFFQFYSAPMPLSRRAAWVFAHGTDAQRNELRDIGGAVPVDGLEMLLDDMGIPSRELSCQLYQRSADTFLGVPFNIASYALLTHMIAQLANHAVGDFVWTGGDVHIYHNHFEQVREYLERPTHELPQLVLDKSITDIDDFELEHIEVNGYAHSGKIAAPVAV